MNYNCLVTVKQKCVVSPEGPSCHFFGSGCVFLEQPVAIAVLSVWASEVCRNGSKRTSLGQQHTLYIVCTSTIMLVCVLCSCMWFCVQLWLVVGTSTCLQNMRQSASHFLHRCLLLVHLCVCMCVRVCENTRQTQTSRVSSEKIVSWHWWEFTIWHLTQNLNVWLTKYSLTAYMCNIPSSGHVGNLFDDDHFHVYDFIMSHYKQLY